MPSTSSGLCIAPAARSAAEEGQPSCWECIPIHCVSAWTSWGWCFEDGNGSESHSQRERVALRAPTLWVGTLFTEVLLPLQYSHFQFSPTFPFESVPTSVSTSICGVISISTDR